MSRRVTVVVGGTSGIGLATARALAARGDRLVLAAREGAAFDAALALVKEAGADDPMAIACDINDRAAVQRMVAEVVDSCGRLDALIHTATVMAYGTLEAMPADVFEQVVDTAVHGTANLARAALPVMRRQERGVFVIVNSLLGSITVPRMGAYATAKWGQRAIARTLQQETRNQPGVHVCVVSPGSINTPIYYQGANVTGRHPRPPVPVLPPEAAARVIVRLLDRPRRHVSVPVGPANPVVIAGFRLFPRLYDRLVGPLFRIAAQTTSTGDGRGNVDAPVPAAERVHGRWPERQP